jgi:hypothetical protein
VSGRLQSGEATFPVERLLTDEGHAILRGALDESPVELPSAGGEAAVLAGALAGAAPDERLTRAELAERVGAFLDHVDSTGQEG